MTPPPKWKWAILLTVATVLMVSSTSFAVPLFESTGDLGNNVIGNAGDFTWMPHLTSPSNSGASELTVKYGLWNHPNVLVDVFVNSFLVGNFLADEGFIIPGPELITFDVTGLLVDGANAILLTGNGANSGDYVVGRVDLRYDSGPSSVVPEPGVLGLLCLGLLALGLRRRKSLNP